MSKLALEPAIVAIFAKWHERAFSTEELVKETGGSPKRVREIAAKHRPHLTRPGQTLQFFHPKSEWGAALACLRLAHPGKSDRELQAMQIFYDAVHDGGLAWLAVRPLTSTTWSVVRYHMCKDVFAVSPFAPLFARFLDNLREDWHRSDHNRDAAPTVADLVRDLKYEREEEPEDKVYRKATDNWVAPHDALNPGAIGGFEFERWTGLENDRPARRAAPKHAD
jgi:hypothetical protein